MYLDNKQDQLGEFCRQSNGGNGEFGPFRHAPSLQGSPQGS